MSAIVEQIDSLMLGLSLKSPVQPAWIDTAIDLLPKARTEIERLRAALRQIAMDCGKVMDDEVCSEAERRTWKAVGRFALAALNQQLSDDR